VIAAYLYLRIMVSMWLSDSSSPRISLGLAARLTMLVTVAITLVFGAVPQVILSLEGLMRLLSS